MTASPLQRQAGLDRKTNPGPQPQSQKPEKNEQPAPSASWQEALAHPETAQPGSFLQLQRAAGNRTVSRLLQAKLTVGAAHDPYEQEADRVAQQVMSAPAGPVQRGAIEEEEVQTRPLAAQVSRLAQRSSIEEEEVQTKALVQRGPMDEEEIQMKPLIQRGPVDEDEIQTKALVQRGSLEEDELQMKPLVQRGPMDEDELQMKPDSGEAFEPGADFETRLSAQRGGGSPLPDGTRQFMESRFGADFSGVRVHTGSASAQLNREVQAQAFTQGSDIFMGAGKYSPGTSAGDELLAHELTHTLQQGAAQTAQRRVQRYPANALEDGSGIHWMDETLTANRSSSGKTGVWFFKGISGPVNELVIKPEYRTANSRFKHPSAAGIAGQFLSSLGINSPKMRNVLADSSEGLALQEVAAAKGTAIPLIPSEDQHSLDIGLITENDAERLSWITIMGKSGGKSVEGASKEAGADASTFTVNRLLNQLKQPALLHKVGQLVALDAFLGNSDRIGFNFANLGNIMYEGQDIVAIDSDSRFLKAMERGQVDDFALSDIGLLFGNPGQYADMFIEGVRSWVVAEAQKLPADQDPQHLIDYFNHYPDFPVWRTHILAGIQAGIQKLRRLLATKKSRQGLKSSFENWKGLGSLSAEWDTLRIRQKMLELRSQYPGLTEAELTARLQQYAEYRQRRANRHFGLKWTAKFF